MRTDLGLQHPGNDFKDQISCDNSGGGEDQHRPAAAVPGHTRRDLHHRTQLRRPFLGEGAEGAVRRLHRQQGLERERHTSTPPLLPGPGRNLHQTTSTGRRRPPTRCGVPRPSASASPSSPPRAWTAPATKTPSSCSPGPASASAPAPRSRTGPLPSPPAAARGDLPVLAVTVDDADADGGPRLLASFHGDSEGLATCPVLGTLDAAARARVPGRRRLRRAARQHWRAPVHRPRRPPHARFPIGPDRQRVLLKDSKGPY
jgi:hypothetical protein